MKSRNALMNVAGESKARADIAAGESKSAPSPEEIRRRAFEICIERVGIDCCDLHDWLQAERELQEKYKETAIGAKKKRGA
jgi:hypothetical protein